MPKITVVACAAYPVALESGRHLAPGGIADVEDTPRIRQDVEAKRLWVIPPRLAPKGEVVTPSPERKGRVVAPKPEEGASAE